MTLAAISVFAPWIASLAIKAGLNTRRNRGFSMKTSFSSGGMPSSHTTLVTAAAVTVFLTTGLSTIFLVSLVVALVVIYDSMNLRRAVEEQIKAINLLLAAQGNPLRLHDSFGHLPREVLAGLALGIGGPVLIHLVFG